MPPIFERPDDLIAEAEFEIQAILSLLQAKLETRLESVSVDVRDGLAVRIDVIEGS